jgi:purine-nucleoside phosphorylase
MTAQRNQVSNHIRRAARCVRKHSPLRPRLAILLGSGFDSFAHTLTGTVRIPYARIPGFPETRVAGHSGDLVLGHSGDTPILLLCGRAHYYEGHSMGEITFPIRVLAELGIESILLTNAAGGIHSKHRPGDVMCLTDHINFMGQNPLRGQMQDGKPCFVDLSSVYDTQIALELRRSARLCKQRFHSGVYLAVSGPSYETPAEIRAFARLGADAVGMSTVPEAIVAHHLGLRVGALSCITNLAAGRNPVPITHQEVLTMGRNLHGQLSRLLQEFVRRHSSKKNRMTP